MNLSCQNGGGHLRFLSANFGISLFLRSFIALARELLLSVDTGRCLPFEPSIVVD